MFEDNVAEVSCVLCVSAHVWFIVLWRQNRSVLRSISIRNCSSFVRMLMDCLYWAVGFSSYAWRWMSTVHTHSSDATNTAVRRHTHTHTAYPSGNWYILYTYRYIHVFLLGSLFRWFMAGEWSQSCVGVLVSEWVMPTLCMHTVFQSL